MLTQAPLQGTDMQPQLGGQLLLRDGALSQLRTDEIVVMHILSSCQRTSWEHSFRSRIMDGR